MYTYFLSYVIPNPFGMGSAAITRNRPISSWDDIQEIQREFIRTERVQISIINFQLLSSPEGR